MNRSPMLSDGRQMRPGPGNIWWIPEPEYPGRGFGPPLPTIRAVGACLSMRSMRLKEDDPEGQAYDLAAEHIRALEDQYADRFAPAVAALDELKVLRAWLTNKRRTPRAIIYELAGLFDEIGMDVGPSIDAAFADEQSARPPSIDRQGVCANYGPRLAERLFEWLDTLDPADAETITIALHRDITDREES